MKSAPVPYSVNLRRFQIVCAVVVALSATVSCVSESKSPPKQHLERRRSPLEGATFLRKSVEAQVLSVEQVPSYTYFQLRTLNAAKKHSEVFWVATLKRNIAVGALVDTRLVAERENFVSRRLERTFSQLYFGVVEVREERTTTAPIGS